MLNKLKHLQILKRKKWGIGFSYTQEIIGEGLVSGHKVKSIFSERSSTSVYKWLFKAWC